MSFDDLDPRAGEILDRYEHRRAALLPLLWLVQRSRGYVSHDAERWIAGHVGTSPAHVHEAVTFYNMIRTAEGGRRELRVCTSLPCRLRGAEELLASLEKELGIEAGETTADGQVTLTEVECLCACEMAPMAQLDERFVGPLEGGTVESVLADCRRPPDAPEATPEPDPHIASDGPVLSTRLGSPDGVWLDGYVAQGGYRGAAEALASMAPEQVTEEVKSAKLRGLGGAGFPAGVKWGFVPEGD
ncbi:MAG: NAD(P)H-dependent oxidoreductase subunit E, partial [Acidobacteriota bacterium]